MNTEKEDLFILDFLTIVISFRFQSVNGESDINKVLILIRYQSKLAARPSNNGVQL